MGSINQIELTLPTGPTWTWTNLYRQLTIIFSICWVHHLRAHWKCFGQKISIKFKCVHSINGNNQIWKSYQFDCVPIAHKSMSTSTTLSIRVFGVVSSFWVRTIQRIYMHFVWTFWYDALDSLHTISVVSAHTPHVRTIEGLLCTMSCG